jgi:hypothetical protein
MNLSPWLIFAASSMLLYINCDETGLKPRQNSEPNFGYSISPHVEAGLTPQLLALSGGAQLKLVWLQARLINEDTTCYVPNYRDFLFNSPSSQLIVYSTDEGTGRILDTIPTSRGTPLISRDGTKVLWSDYSKQALYLINWDGTGKKILLQGDIYQILCVQWDSETQTEWVYISDVSSVPLFSMATGRNICRYALRGTELDMTSKQLVSTKNFTSPWTVSGNGKYAGGDINWPYARIESLPDGPLYQVSDTTMFTCHAQIAPDTSYLFFYLPASHYLFNMHKFCSYLGQVSINIDGNWKWDCCNPRWTNNSRYLTGGYPYCGGWFYSIISNPPPSNPKSIPTGTTGEFCVGKFDTNYTSIQWIRITDQDIRFRKVVGDGWLSDGEGPGK